MAQAPTMHRPDWLTRPAVCIASGPSLTPDDLEAVRLAREADRVRVIGTSDVYTLAPWLDAVFSADLKWWVTHAARLKAAGFDGDRLWTGDAVAAKRFGLSRMRAANKPGLGIGQMHTGGNSGYMAINLAWLWGATRIVLLGYDMQPTGGRKHFFGDHPANLTQQMNFAEWRHRFTALADDLDKRGVRVVNCSRETALQAFPLGRLDAELKMESTT